MQRLLAQCPNLTIRACNVQDVVLSLPSASSPPHVTGLRVGPFPLSSSQPPCLNSFSLDFGEVIPCKTIVVATGTFLGGESHIGLETTPFGRLGEPASHSLSASLREAGFVLARLKTGTPPRLDKRTINFDGLAEQVGDTPASPFSFLTDRVRNEVRSKIFMLRMYRKPTEGMFAPARTVKYLAFKPKQTQLRTRLCRRTCTCRSIFAKLSKVRDCLCLHLTVRLMPAFFSFVKIRSSLLSFDRVQNNPVQRQAFPYRMA